jgi:hypothetical protein
MSILATAAQRGICALDYFIASLTSPAPLPLFASPGR